MRMAAVGLWLAAWWASTYNILSAGAIPETVLGKLLLNAWLLSGIFPLMILAYWLDVYLDSLPRK